MQKANFIDVVLFDVVLPELLAWIVLQLVFDLVLDDGLGHAGAIVAF